MTPTRTSLGFVRLAPGDSLSELGYGFQFENPALADLLGRLTFTHKHDGHAAMVDPTTAATVAVAATGGSIPANTPIHIAYTLTDGQGGETLPIAPTVVTTATGYATPASPPTAAPDYTAGTLLANTYLYAVTVTDGAGGETALGPAASVTVDPGHANARVLVSGLTAITDTASGSSSSAGWRLWRSVDGGSTWDLMATGAHGTDTFTDTGASGGDCTVSPPFTGTTVGTNKLTVTVPATSQPAAATFFSIYADTTGQFLAPCLLGTYPVSDFGSAKVYTALTLLNGAPPAVSSCYPGANQIDPSTDILNWTWKQPVANFAALPGSSNTTGDVRATLDTFTLYAWNGSTWVFTGLTATATQTVTNKRITRRVGSTASSATPTINTDNVDVYALTAQAAAITSFTTNLTGTPVDGDGLIIRITDDGTPRAITWGAKFEASTVALPTTTVASTLLIVSFLWNPATSKWRVVWVA